MDLLGDDGLLVLSRECGYREVLLKCLLFCSLLLDSSNIMH